MTPEDGRRKEDHERFLRLEQNYGELIVEVNALKNKVTAVEGEQRHMRELFDERFQTQNKVLDHLTDMVRGVVANVELLIRDPDKTPAGRALSTAVAAVNAGNTQLDIRVDVLEKALTRIDGVWLVLKYVGWAGLVGIIGLALRGLLAMLP